MPEGGKPYPAGEKQGGLKPNKGQSDAMASMDAQGRSMGWLLDFVRGIAGVQQGGQIQMPMQQPMAKTAVPMMQQPQPLSGVGYGGIPMPSVSGAPALQNVMQQLPSTQQPTGQPPAQQGQEQAPKQGGDSGNVLDTLLKILSFVGGK